MLRCDVVIPCYNYARFLRDSVESVLSQDIDVRVLIIDDASPDETESVARALCKQDGRVSLRRHSVNRGHISSYNEGIEWAESDLFVLLSADDMLMPGALARAAAVFAANPRALMVFGRALYFRDGHPAGSVLDGSIQARPRPENAIDAYADRPASGIPAGRLEERCEMAGPLLDTADFFRRNRLYNRVHTSSVVTRTAAQKRLGGYREDLPHAGDLEMWLRFAAHGPVGFVPRFQGAARVHGANMSNLYYAQASRDIMQRALVLEVIEQSCGKSLPRGLMGEMWSGLAVAAVRAAGIPFSMNGRESCDELLAFARRIDPAVTRSLAWNLFALKRAVGPGLLSRIPPPVRALALRALRLN